MKRIKVIKKIKPYIQSQTALIMNQNKLCLVDSLIPGESPTISFFGKGNCSSQQIPMCTPEPNHKLKEDLWTAAGFKLIRGNNCSAYHVACTNKCFRRANASYSQAPGYFNFAFKAPLYMNLQNLKNPPIPKSFILPEDAKWLQHDMHKNPNRTYIRKPIVGSQGNGIGLISDPAQLNMSKKQIVQRYEKLVLVNGRKFDLRVYFLITSVDPLLVYVYPEGLARFATHEYEEPSAQNMGDKKMHLTNFAQNSEHKQLVSSNYQANKMEMTLLLDYLEKHKFLFLPQVQKTISKEYLFEQIQNTIKLALVGSYRSTLKHWVSGKHYGYYGADIGFKEDGSPILFEINLGPSLNVDTALDFNLKMKMMRQAYELVGLRTGPGDNSSSHEKEFKNWFDDSLPMEEKSALMQIVDEDLRKGDWIRLEFDDLAMGKFNKVVSRSKELIAKEIDKRKAK